MIDATRPFGRTVRIGAVLLLAGLGAGQLAGCAPTPPPDARPAAPAPATSAPPTPTWVPVADAATGVRTELPGPARRGTESALSPTRNARGTVYRAVDPTGRVEAALHVSPLPRADRVDPAQEAERTAHFGLGTLAWTRPVTVGGHRGVDARIDGWSRRGGSGRGVLLLRIVDTPGFGVTVEASGDAADAAEVQRVFDQVSTGLRIP